MNSFSMKKCDNCRNPVYGDWCNAYVGQKRYIYCCSSCLLKDMAGLKWTYEPTY